MDNLTKQTFIQVTDKNGLSMCINVSKILYIRRSGNCTCIGIEGRTDEIVATNNYSMVRNSLPCVIIA